MTTIDHRAKPFIFDAFISYLIVMPKRRSPRRHSVHTRDPRYEVKNYARGTVYPPGDPRFGLETRGHVTKTIHAWDVDDGLDTQINHPYDEPDWRRFHNTTDSLGIDDPQSRKGKGADRKKDDKTKPEQIHEVLRAENPHFMTQYHIKEFAIDGDALKLPIRRGGKQVNVTIESKGGQYEVTAFDLKANAVIYQEDGVGRKNIFDAINLAMSKAKKHKPDAEKVKKKVNNDSNETQQALEKLRRDYPDRNSALYWDKFNEIMDKHDSNKKTHTTQVDKATLVIPPKKANFTVLHIPTNQLPEMLKEMKKVRPYGEHSKIAGHEEVYVTKGARVSEVSFNPPSIGYAISPNTSWDDMRAIKEKKTEQRIKFVSDMLTIAKKYNATVKDFDRTNKFVSVDEYLKP